MGQTNPALDKLCEEIFSLNAGIRFVGVITRMGKLVAGGMRQGTQSMEQREDSSKLYLEFALRNEMRKNFDQAFGKTLYSFSERERIKLASFPFDAYLIRVSMERDVEHISIIKEILALLVRKDELSR
jgi:uncharacterized protein DUF6659